MKLSVPLTIGSGISIVPQGNHLLVTAVNVRFSHVTFLGECVIENFTGRPAAEWGREYAAFAQKLQLTHLAVFVVLPRESVTVRVLSLPPLKRKDLHSAINLQAGSLHPYPEDDACFAWSKLTRRSDVLIALSRSSAIEKMGELFRQAGIAIASFTVPAAVLRSAMRLAGEPSVQNFGAFEQIGDSIELYGESRSRALFSASVDTPDAAESLLKSQLRLPEEHEICPLRQCLPSSKSESPSNSVAYAAALCAASPLSVQPLNLLPEKSRASNSRLRYVPTLALAAGLAGCTLMLVAQNSSERSGYDARLKKATHDLEPRALEAQTVTRRASTDKAKLDQIDSFRNQSKGDLDAINELTRVLPAPAYLTGLDLTRKGLTLTGQASSAAGLLNQIDSSSLFKNSTFTSDIARGPGGELFRIQADRKRAQ